MSKQVEANITCPSCRTKFNTKLYRTIWIEHPEYRDLIFKDKINAVTCPSCDKETRLEFPFLCTNVKKGIAIWYEPYHDSLIDKEVEQYKRIMGADSFYAKAPRVAGWEDFKKTILECEEKTAKPNNIKISSPMHEKISGFINSIKEENKKSKYPKFIKHLSTNTGRLQYSPLPFVLLLFLILVDEGLPSLISDFGLIIFVGIVLTIISYVVLTLLHLIVTKVTPYWEERRDIRLWCFGSLYWLIGVLVFVFLFEPYDGMGDEEYLHMFMVMLLPPLFFGSAKYMYDKYIK